jgi:hypothetical protein
MEGSLVCGNHVLFADVYVFCYCVVLLSSVVVRVLVAAAVRTPMVVECGWRMDLIPAALLILRVRCGVVLACVLVSIVLLSILHWLC